MGDCAKKDILDMVNGVLSGKFQSLRPLTLSENSHVILQSTIEFEITVLAFLLNSL